MTMLGCDDLVLGRFVSLGLEWWKLFAAGKRRLEGIGRRARQKVNILM
jgi:hypothetical protein